MIGDYRDDELARLREAVLAGNKDYAEVEAENARLWSDLDGYMKAAHDYEAENARLREENAKHRLDHVHFTEEGVINREKKIAALTAQRDTLLAALRADLLDAELACRSNAMVAVHLSNILSRARTAISEVEGEK